MMAAQRRLVGDIGGTNSRLALYEPGRSGLQHLRSYRNSEQAGLQQIIADWLHATGEQPQICCLAVAAPPFGDQVSMLNIDWSFSRAQLEREFGFARLHCINDFEGNAYALPHLPATDLRPLRTTTHNDCPKLATLGPGTGFGGATLEYCNDTAVASASEPGHMGLAPATDLEVELFRALLPHYGEVYAELLLSGAGLRRLYRTLAQILGREAAELDADEITARALREQPSLCSQTLEIFCGLLGSACGDYVLTTGSYGGVYLAGGIVPHILPLLERSTFRSRFDAKGNMAQQLKKVPLYAITSEVTGMLGAAHAPLDAAPARSRP